jgi:hypothetical protein
MRKMLDAMMLAAGVAFFVLTLAFAATCERL